MARRPTIGQVPYEPPRIDPARRPAAWAAHAPQRQRDDVARAFIAPDGRIIRMPAKHSKRLILLDIVAQRFEPGQRYSEAQVNAILSRCHDDVAALRRHLVDEGFCDRQHGWYWRTGGSVSG